MDRGKFSTVAPDAEADAVTPKNPWRKFKKTDARAPGRSGKGKVSTGKRSTYGKGRGRY